MWWWWQRNPHGGPPWTQDKGIYGQNNSSSTDKKKYIINGIMKLSRLRKKNKYFQNSRAWFAHLHIIIITYNYVIPYCTYFQSTKPLLNNITLFRIIFLQYFRHAKLDLDWYFPRDTSFFGGAYLYFNFSALFTNVALYSLSPSM